MENSKVVAAQFLPLYNTDLDPFSVISKAFCGFFVRDRFGILNKYSPYKVSDQTDTLPIPFEKPVPFSDLMDQTAIDLINKSNGENIVVCWSGGIDSTGVVVALLKHLTDKTKLKIICAPSALEEYPLFYDEVLLKQGINVKVTNAIVENLDMMECGIITSGWCADQLFGSDTHLHIPEAYHSPWVEGISKLYSYKTDNRIKLSNASLELIEAVYSNYANKLGIELKQYCEFAWLFNFGCKFSFIKETMRLRMPESTNRDKCIPFYAGLDFQRWSVSNFENIKVNNGYSNPSFLKLPIKQYITEYTNDVMYHNKKGKRNSYGMVRETPVDFISILTEDDFKIVRLSDACNSCGNRLTKYVGDLLRKSKL